MQISKLDKNEYKQHEKELNPHALQSYSWGEVKSPNWEPIRYGIFEDDSCISMVSVLTKKIPVLGWKIVYIPRGITAQNPEQFPHIYRVMLQELHRKNSMCILIDPDIVYSRDFNKLEEQKKKILDTLEENNFKEVGPAVQPIRTVVLDLSKNEDELLSEVKSKHRQYIRKADKNGVTVEIGSIEDIDTFYKLLEIIAKERSYTIHGKEYYKKAYEEFSKDRNVVLLMARLKDEVIGSYMVFYNNDTAFEMYGGCPEAGKRMKGNFALKWKSITYAKEIGKKYYDQWGAEFRFPGLVRFKEGFGGKVVNFPKQYGVSLKPFGLILYKILSTLYKLKQRPAL